MINEILFMNGYGIYVWSSFIFTLSCFGILYSVVKIQLVKEQKKFEVKLISIETHNVDGSVTKNFELISNYLKDLNYDIYKRIGPTSLYKSNF